MTLTKKTGIALAMAAAGALATAPMTASAAEEANVHCYGVNKCKGHNDCKTASNECKGHAACKGQGFVSMSAHACDAVGGKVGE